MTGFSSWRTDQWASGASPLVIDWRVHEHSHEGHQHH